MKIMSTALKPSSLIDCTNMCSSSNELGGISHSDFVTIFINLTSMCLVLIQQTVQGK